jgi:hypothetical protein
MLGHIPYFARGYVCLDGVKALQLACSEIDYVCVCVPVCVSVCICVCFHCVLRCLCLQIVVARDNVPETPIWSIASLPGSRSLWVYSFLVKYGCRCFASLALPSRLMQCIRAENKMIFVLIFFLCRNGRATARMGHQRAYDRGQLRLFCFFVRVSRCFKLLFRPHPSRSNPSNLATDFNYGRGVCRRSRHRR